MILTSVALLAALSADCRIQSVEARTASVFAGACHYGGEATTAGREALVAWHFESGSLAGVDLVAAIAGDGNLADPSTVRRSIVYVSDRATPAQRQAAEALLRSRLGSELGRDLGVAVVPIEAKFEGESYRIDGGALFRLEGALLADRACCKMPLAVWYEPIAPISKPVVARNEVFRYSDSRLGSVWEHHGENTGFAGTLR